MMMIYIAMGSVVIAVEWYVAVFEHGYHVFVAVLLIIPTKLYHKAMRESMKNLADIECQSSQAYTT